MAAQSCRESRCTALHARLDITPRCNPRSERRYLFFSDGFWMITDKFENVMEDKGRRLCLRSVLLHSRDGLSMPQNMHCDEVSNVFFLSIIFSFDVVVFFPDFHLYRARLLLRRYRLHATSSLGLGNIISGIIKCL